MLVDKSDNLEIKIADFGFSCVYDPDCGLDLNLGSPLYMAPEIIKQEVYDEKVDIWAVGIITYMLVTGDKNPFNAHSKEDLKKKIVKDEP